MKRRKAIKNLGVSLGIVATTPIALSLLQSCREKNNTLVWQPVFFSSEEAIIVENIIDLILPKSETSPGAIELNIHHFVDSYMMEVFEESQQKEMKEGIQLIIENLTDSSSLVSHISTKDYDEMLSKYLRASKEEIIIFEENKKDKLLLDTLGSIRFWSSWAYKNSEEVGENVLAYNPIPGTFHGCVSLEETTDGKIWSI